MTLNKNFNYAPYFFTDQVEFGGSFGEGQKGCYRVLFITTTDY